MGEGHLLSLQCPKPAAAKPGRALGIILLSLMGSVLVATTRTAEPRASRLCVVDGHAIAAIAATVTPLGFAVTAAEDSTALLERELMGVNVRLGS